MLLASPSPSKWRGRSSFELRSNHAPPTRRTASQCLECRKSQDVSTLTMAPKREGRSMVETSARAVCVRACVRACACVWLWGVRLECAFGVRDWGVRWCSVSVECR